MKKSICFLGTFIICLGVMNVATAQDPGKPNFPQGVNENSLKSHDMKPSNINNVKTEDNKNEKFMNLSDLGISGVGAGTTFNANTFGQKIHAALKDSVTGYVLQLNQNGNGIYFLKWNWGQTPADASQGWEFNTRMHVASVSKYITGLGMMKALKLKGISYDAKIIDYLPTSWVKGPNISQISFRNLFKHTSGFSTGTSSSDYVFMKNRVQMGVGSVGGYDYENMNFGLCRILIPIVMGYMSKDLQLTDGMWDGLSISWFKSFMQNYIFTPSGVANADFVPSVNIKNAFAYRFPHNNQDGWNSGNLASVSGGAGWRLSVVEVLKVMDHARRKGDILPASDVQYGLDNYFGIDQVISTPAGNLYNKNGSWGDGVGNTEQSVAYFFPNNMELVVFINSPIGKAKSSLRGLVKDVFLASLQ